MAIALPRPTGRRTVLALATLSVVALGLVLASPEIAARFAEPRVEREAIEIGDALVADYAQTGTFPRNLVADNTDRSRPEILADSNPLPRVTLAPGMSIYYYSSEPKNFFSFCLEHHPQHGQPNAFAVYGTHAKTKKGDISQTGHGNGCMSAE